MKRVALVGVMVLSLGAAAHAQTNSWIDGNGKWETGGNWSRLLAPSTSDSADWITNAGNKTVTIDATTSGGFPGTMTISNLTIGANSLQLTNAGTAAALHILNQFIMTNGAALLITNSAVQIDGGPQVRVTSGRVTLLSGLLNVNSNELNLGSTGNAATLTVAGGSLGAGRLSVGNTGTGVVWVTGGTLVSTSSTTFVGSGGVGSLILSNGTVRSSLVIGASGTLSIQGGTLIAALTINSGGAFIFGQGLFETTSAQRSGSGTFVIGDGTHSATMKLLGGPTQTYNLQSGLTVSSNAYLIGCGQITGGNVLNYGKITNGCAGGTLNFSSGNVVTNNGSIVATNGATIEFDGPVINNGLIDTLSGHIHFNSTFTNSGTLLNAGSIRVTPSNLNFSSVIVGTTAQASFTVTNVGGTAVTGTAHFASGFNFGVVSGSPFNLAAHGATNVVVGFTPSFDGQSSDSAVFEANGDSFTETVQGVGVSYPVAKFTATPTYGAAPLSVFFSDLSTGTITNELWLFGDGTSTNNPFTASHTYQVPGTSTVTLIVSGPLGVSTNTQVNLILAAPSFTPNSYTNPASGKWETGGNWSLGVPPNFAQGQIYITNVTSKTVTIDSTTSASFPTTMNIGNLSVWSPQDSTNTLLLSNAGTNTPLRIRGNFYVGNRSGSGFGNNVGGVVIVTNSAIQLDGSAGSFEVGGTITIRSGGVIVGAAPDIGSAVLSSPGALWVVGGTLVVTNGVTSIGSSYSSAAGEGQLTLSNGTVQAADVVVSPGSFTGMYNPGTLTVAGGKMTLSGGINVAPSRVSRGTVLVTGGELTMTNGDIGLATRAIAAMTVSNAIVSARGMSIATGLGSSGVLTLEDGGTMMLLSNLVMATGNNGGQATVWVKGGQLLVTNGDITVGNSVVQGGKAQLIVSNGSVLARSVRIASEAWGAGIGSLGTLTVAGGTVQILQGTNGLVIGSGLGNTGVVEVTGGQLLFGSSPLVLGDSGVGVMTVSNGTATAQHARIGVGTNSLGALTLQTGSMMTVSSNLIAGAGVGSTATVSIVGGQLAVTNGVFGVGNDGSSTNGTGVGHVIVSNGTVLASIILLGSSAGGHGDLTILSNGVVSFAMSSAGTNTAVVCNDLNVKGGTLHIENGTLYAGKDAPETFTISDGGMAICLNTYIGFNNTGTMTIADGGTMTNTSRLVVGENPGSTGQVWVTGGQLLMTSSSLATKIGNDGVGQLTLSNGSVQATRMWVSNSSNPGTLSIQGGSLTANLLINPNGRLLFGQGQLIASATTNANGQSFVIGDGVRPATMKLTGGIHSFDNGLEVSAYASLTGCGTISGSVVVDAGGTVLADCGGTLTFMGTVNNHGTIFAAAGSTIDFNGLVVNYGVIITNSAIHFNLDLINNGVLLDAAADADGDGMNNLSEVLAGTDPLNSASVFRVLAIVREGNDLRVTWSTVGGKRYVVQTSPGASGSYSNNFTDLGATISMPGKGESTTSYLDLGAATSNAARYYRVRLLP